MDRKEFIMRIVENMNRVQENTAPEVNDQIARECRMRIDYFRQHPHEIRQRLSELEKEWDIERALAVNSSVLTLTGLALSFLKGRHWSLLSATVQGFYVQHALTGWCPPLPVLRQLGFRTTHEIETERHALLDIQESDDR
jgi:hypothetical protein